MASAERPRVSVWIRQPSWARLGGRYNLSVIRASRIRFGPGNRVGPRRGHYTLVVSEPRFRRFWKKSLNDFVKGFLIWYLTYIEFAYKGLRDSYADLVGLTRRSMDGSGSQRVAGDQGDRLDSLTSVEGGQADELKSHLFLVHFSVLFPSKNE